MKDYQIDDCHNLSGLKSSKEKWKERALLKQKKLRASEAKLLHTAFSRDRWKDKAINTKKELAFLKALIKEKDTEIERLKKNIRGERKRE